MTDELIQLIKDTQFLPRVFFNTYDLRWLLFATYRIESALTAKFICTRWGLQLSLAIGADNDRPLMFQDPIIENLGDGELLSYSIVHGGRAFKFTTYSDKKSTDSLVYTMGSEIYIADGDDLKSIYIKLDIPKLHQVVSFYEIARTSDPETIDWDYCQLPFSLPKG